ncbi:AMP-binding protein [Sphingopyxis sp. FD7]|uniref:AMP-binding protein n=1 Tax=Sphingopyxis sp. FD7 TaxID=1914525 RepID=UPI000DC61AA7|nr:AMP-binding protein [Sphingopyxis sp. FD7]BBB14010.1 AMP-dependent synthetase [Sphingopyxis sp. FD7]
MSAPVRPLLRMVLDGVASNMSAPIVTFVDIDPEGTFVEEARTYADLLLAGRELAGALRGAGMVEGDAFALIMRNHPEFLEAMVASEIAGTVFVPIDPRTRGDKLAYMLRFSRCRGAIVSRDVLPHLNALREGLPDLAWVWVIDDLGSNQDHHALADVRAAAKPVGEVAPRPADKPMQMLFTSGTTGDPKAILAPHARFAAVASLGAVIGLKPNDILYTGLSLTHANAQLITLGNGLSLQLPVIISRQFTKSRLWEILARYGCTTFNLLGGMATAIFAEPDGPFDRAHKVRFVLSAGMPASMWRAFEDRFGVGIFEFFGAAEGGLSLNPPGTGPVGSIGKPPGGGICEILGSDGTVLPALEPGEICFRNEDGSVAPVTYFGNPEASAAKTRNGWFHTGDIGWKDENGWLFFSHRDGHSIRRNGDFIDGRAIETAIAAMPGVADTYVYGLSTPRNTPGEKEVIAAIVAGDGFDAAMVIPACAAALGSANVPTYLQIVQAIPKTASEKPQDRHLAAMLEEGNCHLFDRNGLTTWNTSEERITS